MNQWSVGIVMLFGMLSLLKALELNEFLSVGDISSLVSVIR